MIAEILGRVPKGQRFRVAVTEEPSANVGSKPDLVDWLLACPEQGWFEPMERGETTRDLTVTTFE